MARMSQENKDLTHKNIIRNAARLFREKGIEATSLGDVMKASGLTHGGFYRHFPGKEALAVVAINSAVDEILDDLEQDIQRRGTGPAIAAYVENYLSFTHVTSRGVGCPLAALIDEGAGKGGDIQTALQNGYERMLGLLSEGFHGQNRKHKAAGLMAVLIGTVQLARAQSSPAKAGALIKSGRRVVDMIFSQPE